MKLDAVTVGFSLDGQDQEADVQRLYFVEGLSELCEADITLALPAAAAAAVLPGASARITIARGLDESNVRWICGVVRSVEGIDQGDGMSLERPLLRVCVVPRVWRAGLAARSRAFEDSSIDAVLTKTLQDHGLQLTGAASSTARPLIVQYQETDLALMFRLLEDIGVSHHVKHTESEDVWTLFDADPERTRSGAPRPLVWTTLATGQSSDEGVLRAGRVGELTTKNFKVSDIDRRVEREVWTGKGRSTERDVGRELREPRRVEGDGAALLAQRVTDEHHAAHDRYWMETSDLQLAPGERVDAELSRADAAGGLTTELLVVRVAHEIETSEDAVVYRNRAEAVTFATPFRPARLTPRPTITAPQTGLVESFREEKHQLEVNVLMDWGAERPFTLPVRMTQPIAGSNHGSVLLPHIDSEVLVHFIDGVPERPVLIGALYHQAATAAVAGGTNDGKSSYLSRFAMLGKRGPTSTIDVDDATQDAELIKMVAINDVDVTVGRNEKRLVKGTSDEEIQGDVTVALGAKRSTTVTADETYAADSNVSITVQKTGRVLVNQTLQMTADTKLSLISGNTRADFSPSAAKITVGASVIEATASSVKITVGGSVVELTASGIKLSTGGAAVELNAGAVKLGAPKVDINNGGLTVM